MPLQLGLMRQESVQSRVESVGVNLLGGDAQQIIQGRAAIPGVLDVQLAGWLAEGGRW